MTPIRQFGGFFLYLYGGNKEFGFDLLFIINSSVVWDLYILLMKTLLRGRRQINIHNNNCNDDVA